jgi:hypothetical protein
MRFLGSRNPAADTASSRGDDHMLRSAIAAVLIYAYGHPDLEAARPAVLDAPLQGFHRDINMIISDGYRVITRFDDDRAVAAVKSYADHLDTQLRAKD